MDRESLHETPYKETGGKAESCFEEIYNYKFQESVKFIEGWRKVKDVIGKDEMYESLLKAQVYFYSREVGPIDLHGYKNWLQENNKDVQEFDAFMSDETSSKPTEKKEEHDKSLSVESKTENILNSEEVNSDTKSVEIKVSDSSTGDDVVEKHPANFIELIEMIQSGMKLPGTEDLNIEPLNEDPTPCDLQRPKKPWEVS